MDKKVNPDEPSHQDRVAAGEQDATYFVFKVKVHCCMRACAQQGRKCSSGRVGHAMKKS